MCDKKGIADAYDSVCALVLSGFVVLELTSILCIELREFKICMHTCKCSSLQHFNRVVLPEVEATVGGGVEFVPTVE